MKANRRDVAYITVNVTDSKGNFVPDADVDVNFEIEGDYKLIGVENGDVLDIAKHKVLNRKTFKGKALLILQSTAKQGKIKVKANSPQLKSSQLLLTIK